MRKILAHVVTFNSSASVVTAVRSLIDQNLTSASIEIRITDNASRSDPRMRLSQEFGDRIVLARNSSNLGFCGAHNQAATSVVKQEFDYLLILNPDVRLEEGAVGALMGALERYPEAGLACPLLLRANENLEPINPSLIDAAGMYMTPQLRHFDRGAGKSTPEQFEQAGFVFGASGACILLRKDFIEDVCIKRQGDEKILESVAEHLSEGALERLQLFDEAFLAYREDADLAWRAQILGWKCRYVPEARGYHTRVVLPERRAQLPAALNRYSVRNRFLMQLNNYSIRYGLNSFLQGILWRNILVIVAVILWERSSLQALRDVVRLGKRALKQRKWLYDRARYPHQMLHSRGQLVALARWFKVYPTIEIE